MVRRRKHARERPQRGVDGLGRDIGERLKGDEVEGVERGRDGADGALQRREHLVRQVELLALARHAHQRPGRAVRQQEQAVDRVGKRLAPAKLRERLAQRQMRPERRRPDRERRLGMLQRHRGRAFAQRRARQQHVRAGILLQPRRQRIQDGPRLLHRPRLHEKLGLQKL